MVMENTREYPRLCAYFYFNRVCLHVNHPDLIKQVLSSQYCLGKTHEYKLTGWGLGLGTAPPEYWRVSRKHINPALGTKSLMTFLPIFDECSRGFVEKLKPKVGKGAFDLFQTSVLVTLDSICGELRFEKTFGLTVRHILRHFNINFLATSFGVKVNALEKNIQFNRHLEKYGNPK